MNKYIYTILCFTFIVGCTDLNMNPLSRASTENWYKNEEELNMSINGLYKASFWSNASPDWTDDWIYRETLTPITSATINGEWGTVNEVWTNAYKAITRANTIINVIETGNLDISEDLLQRYTGEARFVRASQYAKLISYFGDVVFYTEKIDLDEAYTMPRTDKNEILKTIYEDYDYAIENLPTSYSDSEVNRATKGAALAYKARIALYNEDWEIARDATEEVISMDVYELYPDFGELFLPKTGSTIETIFSIPRSEEFDSYNGDARNYLPRNSGGWAAKDPSWDLFCAFLSTDGLPIDESPLFDPRNPFESRDPRLGHTIVEFQTLHLGVMYQPHPDSVEVYNSTTGEYQINQDTRSNQEFASFNGLLWKKGIDESWAGDFREDSDIILMRYADVLLMYAEAKIELGDIDQSVLDAINRVRARAYQVPPSSTEYPAVATMNEQELRKILRIERRMEFALEGLRYMDIIRWGLAEKVLNKPNYGLLDPDELKEKVIDPGLWFFPYIPEIDEDGVADFSEMAEDGLIKQISNRKFDASKQYLWPIPTSEILINDNMTQNPGY